MAMASRRRGRSPPPAAAAPPRDTVAAAPSPPSHFPPDLLRDVASRVTSLHEFFALRAVCRAALPLAAPSLASQPPLPLVPDTAAASHALLHIRRGFHRFRLTRTHLTGETTDVHSLGCRVAVDLRERCQLRIVHVLTGERTRLPSPPSPFSGLLLSGDLVVAWDSNHPSLQHCRLGNPKMRVASAIDPFRFHDLIFVSGTLYALVTPGYRLAVVSLSDNSNSEELELEFLGGELGAETSRQNSVFCLADCCGELLLVARPEEHHYRWQTFHVFRWQSGEQKWDKIARLGGCTLFLANYRFAGCLGPHHPEIRGDCIYYTIPGLLRVHSLVNESVSERIINYPIGKVPMEFCQSVWVFPSMC
ncbi:hypothetical protein HU200_062067 [Digitaria exilis]|uniref:KIB1-4 beta-propeller domain-containing protein n=1 Tax=Digitaria exilis TaxID=1010633 RepID=A0A835ABM6_9POAL|nr:hypothetical protein HU200_062067 [Digitaria exilis]